jgi:hypothetical protein
MAAHETIPRHGVGGDLQSGYSKDLTNEDLNQTSLAEFVNKTFGMNVEHQLLAGFVESQLIGGLRILI